MEEEGYVGMPTIVFCIKMLANEAMAIKNEIELNLEYNPYHSADSNIKARRKPYNFHQKKLWILSQTLYEKQHGVARKPLILNGRGWCSLVGAHFVGDQALR